MRWKLFVLLVTGIAGLGMTGAMAEGGAGVVEIRQPWARASVLMSRPAAVYLTIVNKGPRPDRHVAATSQAAGEVTIHLSEMSGGVMSMTKMDSIVLEPGERLVLEPGGMHLMLMQLKAPLRKGSTLCLSLTFERAGMIEVSAPVLSPGAKGPE